MQQIRAIYTGRSILGHPRRPAQSLGLSESPALQVTAIA
jgi:hypothetical protein